MENFTVDNLWVQQLFHHNLKNILKLWHVHLKCRLRVIHQVRRACLGQHEGLINELTVAWRTFRSPITEATKLPDCIIIIDWILLILFFHLGGPATSSFFGPFDGDTFGSYMVESLESERRSWSVTRKMWSHFSDTSRGTPRLSPLEPTIFYAFRHSDNMALLEIYMRDGNGKKRSHWSMTPVDSLNLHYEKFIKIREELLKLRI